MTRTQRLTPHFSPRHRRWTVGVGALAVLALATATTAAEADADDEITELEVTAVEDSADGATTYRFELPDEVPAGATRISLDNEGTEPHHAQLFRLADGITFDDLAAALATGNPAAASEVGAFVGGTALVDAGEESQAEAIVELEPGQYALICFVPGADGAPHLAHGMLQPFEVVEGEGLPAPAPTPDEEIELVDYAFAAPAEIERDAVLRITNDTGTEPHEMIVGRLHDDATVDDVQHALDHGEAPPATFVGGMQALPPGASAYLELDVEPGRYLLICEVPSADGTPHRSMGMVAEVTVT